MQKRHLHEFYQGECLGSPHTSYGGANDAIDFNGGNYAV